MSLSVFRCFFIGRPETVRSEKVVTNWKKEVKKIPQSVSVFYLFLRFLFSFFLFFSFPSLAPGLPWWTNCHVFYQRLCFHLLLPHWQKIFMKKKKGWKREEKDELKGGKERQGEKCFSSLFCLIWSFPSLLPPVFFTSSCSPPLPFFHLSLFAALIHLNSSHTPDQRVALTRGVANSKEET